MHAYTVIMYSTCIKPDGAEHPTCYPQQHIHALLTYMYLSSNACVFNNPPNLINQLIKSYILTFILFFFSFGIF